MIVSPPNVSCVVSIRSHSCGVRFMHNSRYLLAVCSHSIYSYQHGSCTGASCMFGHRLDTANCMLILFFFFSLSFIPVEMCGRLNCWSAEVINGWGNGKTVTLESTLEKVAVEWYRSDGMIHNESTELEVLNSRLSLLQLTRITYSGVIDGTHNQHCDSMMFFSSLVYTNQIEFPFLSIAQVKSNTKT